MGLSDSMDTRATMGITYLRNAVEAIPTVRALLLYGAASWSFLLLFGGVITVVPLLVASRYTLDATEIGLLITTALLVTALISLLNGRLTRILSTATLLSLGFIGYGLGLAGAGLATSPVLIAAALVVFGVDHGLVFPTLTTAISGLAGSQYRAGVMSIRTSMLMLGQAVSPWLFTLVGVRIDYPLLLFGVGVCSVVFGGSTLLVVQTDNHPTLN